MGKICFPGMQSTEFLGKHFDGHNANILRVQNVRNECVSKALVSSRLVD